MVSAQLGIIISMTWLYPPHSLPVCKSFRYLNKTTLTKALEATNNTRTGGIKGNGRLDRAAPDRHHSE